MNAQPGRHVAFPLSASGTGRIGFTDRDTYLRGLIEAVLFTRPGERVNRPDFGSEVNRLVFAPLDPESAAATRALVQAALQRQLGEVVRIDEVEVDASLDSTVNVTVRYVPLAYGSPVGAAHTVVVGPGSARGLW